MPLNQPSELPSEHEELQRRDVLKLGIGGLLANLLSRINLAAENKDDHHEHDIEDLRARSWKSQDAAYAKALRLEKEEATDVYSAEKLREAFSSEGLEIVVCCMDERIVTGKGQLKVSIAGSGILFDSDEFKQLVTKLKAAGIPIRAITHHEGCGACAKFCKDNDLTTDPQVEGKKFAERLMLELGIKGESPLVGYEHGGKKPPMSMDGDPHLHHARGIVLDATGRFQPRKLGLPSSFELSVPYFPNLDQVVGEFEVAIKIATGDHGMGEKRFESAPIVVTLVKNPLDPGATAELEKAIAPVLAKYAKFVKLVKLSPPKDIVKKE